MQSTVLAEAKNAGNPFKCTNEAVIGFCLLIFLFALSLYLIRIPHLFCSWFSNIWRCEYRLSVWVECIEIRLNGDGSRGTIKACNHN